MTAKIISTYIAAGYTLSATYTQLTITATGGVGGTGLFAGAAVAMVNDGSIHGSGEGANLAGGSVINGSTAQTTALIEGIYGVVEYNSASVSNFATILSTSTVAGNGVVLRAGGTVINQGAAALISGGGGSGSAVDIFGAAGEVSNSGQLTATNGSAVELALGGAVTNSAGGTITGAAGIYVKGGSGLVTNSSLITSTKDAAVGLHLGGAVTNQADGTITGATDGVYVTGGTGSVTNAGLISGANYAVYLKVGGSVANGAAGDTTAQLVGGVAIAYTTAAAGTVTNFGTILGRVASGNAVLLYEGGSVTNGSAADTAALIEGRRGVNFYLGSGTATNFGTIMGTIAPGMYLGKGGLVTNGSTLDTTALIEGGYGGIAGVHLAGAGTVNNFGTIENTNTAAGVSGVYLSAGGGAVTNGASGDTIALIAGYVGVYTKGAVATVGNFGTILGTGANAVGVYLDAGGTVTNQGVALINGGGHGILIQGGAGKVTNAGSIIGTKHNAVALGAGGNVINLAGGTITAASDVIFITGGTGSVTNSGVIDGLQNRGVYLDDGGSVTNGALGDTTAQIEGEIQIAVATGVVANFGTVNDTGTVSGFYGVSLAAGGVVTNGAATDTIAQIAGHTGVETKGATASVNNFATILGTGANGVYLDAGGTVINQAGALISGGSNGILVQGGAGKVTNAGTIWSTGYYESGVEMVAGGSVVNLATGVIKGTGGGGGGVFLVNGTLTNAGTISGNLNDAAFMFNGGVVTNDAGGLLVGQIGVNATHAAGTVLNHGSISTTDLAAIDFHAGGQVSNLFGGVITGDVEISGGVGTVTNAGQIIAAAPGQIGVVLSGAFNDTLINSGTITGYGSGPAVQFGAGADHLTIDPGAVFAGGVDGGAGVNTLELGGTTAASFTGLGAQFTRFQSVTIDTGSSWNLTGNNLVAAGVTFTDNGTMTVTGALSGSGTLAVAGAVNINAGSSLAVAAVNQTAGAANFNTSTSFAGVWTQSGGAINAVASGVAVTFAGPGNTFSGTLGGPGFFVLTGGTDLLSGTSLSATTTITGAAVTLSGVIALNRVLTASSANLTIAAAGATLSGAGELYLNNLATSMVVGATASTLLTNASNIDGAGQLGGGQMALTNAVGGVIDATLSTALTINLGTNALTNAGLIESTSTGGLSIAKAVVNTGTLSVFAGTLSVGGAVIGTGTVNIHGGTAYFGLTFAENVAFTGASGELELTRSQTYTGQISGFSLTGGTSLDLLDIAFGGSTHATFSGTTTSGTLTVTDGTHTSHISLIGNYTGSTWTVSTDGHGGTKVIDPTKPAATVLPLAAAMAGFGASPVGHLPCAPVDPLPNLAIFHAPS